MHQHSIWTDPAGWCSFTLTDGPYFACDVCHADLTNPALTALKFKTRCCCALTMQGRLLGRGAYCLVFNQQGELFVSQRSMTKVGVMSHTTSWRFFVCATSDNAWRVALVLLLCVWPWPCISQRTRKPVIRCLFKPRVAVSSLPSRQDVWPGCYDALISGVVQAGEEYEETMVRCVE